MTSVTLSRNLRQAIYSLESMIEIRAGSLHSTSLPATLPVKVNMKALVHEHDTRRIGIYAVNTYCSLTSWITKERHTLVCVGDNTTSICI